MIEIVQINDIETLMAMRMEVIRCVFNNPSQQTMDTLAAANRRYYQQHLRNGDHVAYMALIDDAVAGCGAICFYHEMPSPDNPSGLCAYLMNIYVRPQYRCRGVASSIVNRLVKKAKTSGAGKIYLESTDMAHNLYTNAGFHTMENMMKYENP